MSDLTKKESIYLNIAGFNIEVNFLPTEWEFAKNLKKEEIKKYWRGFIINNPKKIDFRINFKEINYLRIFEKNKFKYLGFYKKKSKKTVETYYQISIFQFQTILRDVVDELLDEKGFYLHASASAINEFDAIIYTGPNGSGKSTIMKKMTDRGFKPLADDTVIIKKERKNIYLYQSPMIEKEWWIKKDYKKYQIKEINFMKNWKLIKITKNNIKNYLIKIIQQIWINRVKNNKVLAILIKIFQ
ncbi:MAG: hypothetical protein Fur009_6180 [Candidatus Microgenomates bacterium]